MIRTNVKMYILIRRKDKFIGTFIDGCVFEFLEIKLTHSPFTLWTSVFTSFEKLSSNNFFFEKKPQKRKTSLVPISYANILTEFSHELYRKI